MKTLYVTDLDGTLMRNDMTISDESVRILNEPPKRGMQDGDSGAVGPY